MYIVVLPDSSSKLYAPQFNITYKVNTNGTSLQYLSSLTDSSYTGSVLAPSLALPFIVIALIVLSIVGAYYSNKLCFKISKDHEIPKDYLTAGEKPNEVGKWKEIEIEMMKRNLDEAPKNAPKSF